jgi:hypothetical protein
MLAASWEFRVRATGRVHARWGLAILPAPSIASPGNGGGGGTPGLVGGLLTLLFSLQTVGRGMTFIWAEHPTENYLIFLQYHHPPAHTAKHFAWPAFAHAYYDATLHPTGTCRACLLSSQVARAVENIRAVKTLVSCAVRALKNSDRPLRCEYAHIPQHATNQATVRARIRCRSASFSGFMDRMLRRCGSLSPYLPY